MIEKMWLMYHITLSIIFLEENKLNFVVQYSNYSLDRLFKALKNYHFYSTILHLKTASWCSILKVVADIHHSPCWNLQPPLLVDHFSQQEPHSTNKLTKLSSILQSTIVRVKIENCNHNNYTNIDNKKMYWEKFHNI